MALFVDVSDFSGARLNQSPAFSVVLGDPGFASMSKTKTRGGIVALLVVLVLLLVFFNLISLNGPPHQVQLPPQFSVPHNLKVAKLLEVWDSHLKNPQLELLNHFPRPPHLHNCRDLRIQNDVLDSRDELGNRPKWTLWKGKISSKLKGNFGGAEADDGILGNTTRVLESPLPPWVEGGDEDNLPMTRRAQRDLWVIQHPRNCSDPSLRFLFVEWGSTPKLGLGAQIVAMSGAFAIAVNEKRILVTGRFNRASHPQCKGRDFERWSCYFAPETSCRDYVDELMKNSSAWSEGRIRHLGSKEDTWFTRTPEIWGRPWDYMQPSEASMGNLVMKHKAMDRQWWRSQVVRYLMRFSSEYLCTLLNIARHEAFGEEAAKIVARSLPSKWPNVSFDSSLTPGESILWERNGPWVPRPLLSVHVRQGDKGKEMSIYGFDAYMRLAQRVRERFPELKNVWLSTEMQNVVDESKGYADWNFFYTKIARQQGNTSMGDYERSLGTELGSKNAFVNLMMALDCDYFVGVLGSTWSFLLNGLRATSGKVKAGFLSVNLDRYW